jgi:hypothetical protein
MGCKPDPRPPPPELVLGGEAGDTYGGTIRPTGPLGDGDVVGRSTDELPDDEAFCCCCCC